MRNLMFFLISLVIAPFSILWCAVRLCLSKEIKHKNRCIFYFSQVVWNDVWQRPQELSLWLSDKRIVVYCSPIQLHHYFLTLRDHLKCFQMTGKSRNICVLSPIIVCGHYQSRCIFLLNCMMIRLLLSVLKCFVPCVDYLTDTPYSVPVIRNSVTGRISGAFHYDVIDDFTAFAWSPHWSRRLDDYLMRNAKSVTTGTLYLQRERQNGRIDEVHFVSVGVRGVEFVKPSHALPEDVLSIPYSKIAGYVGSITERLDLDLISHLVKAFPDVAFVFIGPCRLASNLFPPAPNLFLLGNKKHSDLPDYIHAFSVGLIPFRLDDATRKLFPVKTMEYMAAGIPVISTCLPDIEEYFSQYLLTAHNALEFADVLRKVLAGDFDRNVLETAKTFALSHTWEEMGRKLYQCMKDIEYDSNRN